MGPMLLQAYLLLWWLNLLVSSLGYNSSLTMNCWSIKNTNQCLRSRFRFLIPNHHGTLLGHQYKSETNETIEINIDTMYENEQKRRYSPKNILYHHKDKVQTSSNQFVGL